MLLSSVSAPAPGWHCQATSVSRCGDAGFEVKQYEAGEVSEPTNSVPDPRQFTNISTFGFDQPEESKPVGPTGHITHDKRKETAEPSRTSVSLMRGSGLPHPGLDPQPVLALTNGRGQPLRSSA